MFGLRFELGLGFGLSSRLGVRVRVRSRVRNILDRNKRRWLSWTGTSVDEYLGPEQAWMNILDRNKRGKQFGVRVHWSELVHSARSS